MALQLLAPAKSGQPWIMQAARLERHGRAVRTGHAPPGENGREKSSSLFLNTHSSRELFFRALCLAPAASVDSLDVKMRFRLPHPALPLVGHLFRPCAALLAKASVQSTTAAATRLTRSAAPA
mmetsp:Transcript_74571/g.210909  ORF Transcript_74571/g.210909 Transcript_74571/m.210909 type:complete len:123 (-) Transcript_74571:966-1334(-)